MVTTIKLKAKIAIDVAMIVVLLLLMGHMITGKDIHKIIGIVMYCLWIVHNILNRKWYTSFKKGRYTFRRIIDTTVNILLIFLFTGLIVSSVIISGSVYRIFGTEAGMSFARKLHLVSIYWCFTLSSLHMGLHWNRIKKIIENSMKTEVSRMRTVTVQLIVLFLSGFGVYAFIKHQMISYMFLRILFVFFDYEQPVFSFFFDYFCMMILFASLSYYSSKLTTKKISFRRMVWCPQHGKIK